VNRAAIIGATIMVAHFGEFGNARVPHSGEYIGELVACDGSELAVIDCFLHFIFARQQYRHFGPEVLLYVSAACERTNSDIFKLVCYLGYSAARTYTFSNTSEHSRN
jgi:hypothetical protein